MHTLSIQDLSRLAVTAARRKRTQIFVVTITMIIAALLLTTLRAPSYKTSWVLLLPGTERSSTVNLDNIGEARTTTRNAYGNVSLSPKHTYREIALSQAVMSKAAKNFGVERGAFTKPNISLVQQTSAIRFTLKGSSAEKLKARATVFNAAFHQTLDELRQNELERQDQGIQDQLVAAKTRLANTQKKVVEFKATAHLVADEQLPLKAQTLEKLRAQLLENQVQLAQSDQLVASNIKMLGVDAKQAKLLRTLVSYPGLVATVGKLNEAKSELTVLTATTGPEYPRRKRLHQEVSTLNDEIARIKRGFSLLNDLSLDDFVGWVSHSNTDNLTPIIADHMRAEGLQAQQEKLISLIANLAQDLRTYTHDAAQLDSLERDYQIAEAIFSSALTRLDSSKFDIYATYPLTQLLTEPGTHIQRDHLVPKLIVATALVLYGLLILLLIVWEMRQRILEEGQAK